jgi:hypothetical protein
VADSFAVRIAAAAGGFAADYGDAVSLPTPLAAPHCGGYS